MSKEKEPSLKVNMLLNMVKSLMGILFPLITFPYITRVLGTENIGKYNFAQSIVGYFVLLAGLGVSMYAIREGAKVRDDKYKIEEFASEVYTINMIATIVSYALLICTVIFIPKLFNYRTLIFILSIQIVCKTIGFEWIYSVYEDFLFVTVRSIAFQFLSLCLMFLFVKNSSDLYMYTVIVVIAGAGSEIINHFFARKYCRIRFTRRINLAYHMKPILMLFAMAAAVMVYVNLDMTMLGFICDDYTVGIYSVSVKIYTILKTVIAAALLVYIPRISMHVEKNDLSAVNNILTEAYNIMITLMVPVAVGVFVLRKEVVLILSGDEYMSATSSLAILCVALVFCLLAGYWSQAILIPFRMEKHVLIATIISASVNLVLNFILIPVWKENAAAVTTLISEFVAFQYCYLKAKRIVQITDSIKTFLKVLLGGAGIIVVYCVVGLIEYAPLIKTIIVVLGSVLVYLVIELSLKNKAFIDIVKLLKDESNRKI